MCEKERGHNQGGPLREKAWGESESTLNGGDLGAPVKKGERRGTGGTAHLTGGSLKHPPQIGVLPNDK